MKSISLKIITILIISIIGIMTIVTGLRIITDLHANNTRTRNKSELVLNRLKKNLINPLWNYNYENIKIIIESELTDPDILAIIIKNEEGNHLRNQAGDIYGAEIKNEKWEITPYTPDTQETRLKKYQTFVEKENIYKEEYFLGSIEIYITDYFNRLHIKRYISGVFFQTIFLSAAIILISFIALKMIIINPIISLHNAVKKIIKGDLNINLEIKTGDEIGILSSGFISMIDKLKSNFEKIERQNQEIKTYNEKLESIVSERTLELETKNKELEKALNTLKDSQEKIIDSEKMAALGRLVFGLTHEMNTPLGTSITSTSFLKEKIDAFLETDTDKNTTEELKSYIEIIQLIDKNLARVSQMTNNFKELAVNQATETSIPINAYQYINDVVNIFEKPLNSSNHKVTVNCRKDMKIKTIPNVFVQILMNLISNSIFHGFENRERCEIIISLSEENEECLLNYKDNGSGIDESIQHFVFEPFYTTKRNKGGLGLGLNIIYNLVKFKLHGSITLESEKDKGVNINIKLPNTDLQQTN